MKHRVCLHLLIGCCMLLGLLMLVSPVLWSQESKSTIAGTVTDPQGALVPAAKVEFKNLGTNLVSSTATTGAGVYSMTTLNPGQYDVTVSAAGFKSSVRSNIELRVGARMELDFRLEIGAVSETVEVTGQAPLLETGTASQGTVIGQSQITNLPVLNNNVFTLMRLTVGAVNTQGSTPDSTRPWDSDTLSNYNVTGSDGYSSEYLLEGSPNTNRGTKMGDKNASQISAVPPSDSVGEFKMQTNTYDAEFGRSGGGVVNISLRSGTNAFHGSLYEYWRNDILNANSVQNINQKKGRDPVRWNQPGGSLTGPIIKDKLFFMFSMEAIRQHIPSPAQLTVPTLAEREGDFSQTIGANGQPIKVYDSTTTTMAGPGQFVRTEFPGSKIPTQRMDPVALKLLQYIPKPNIIAPRGQANLLVSPNVVFNTYNTYVSRVDYTLSSKNSLYATFNHSDYHKTGGTQAFENIQASPSSETKQNDNAITLNFTSLLTTNFVSTSRVNFSRHTNNSLPYGFGFNPSSLGFPSSLVPQLPALTFPSITLQAGTVGGGGGPGGPGGPPGPPGPPGGGGGGGLIGSSGTTFYVDNTYTFGQTFSLVVAQHALKFGAEFRAMLNNNSSAEDPAVVSSSGSFTFNPGFTQANPNAYDGNSGDPTASFLLGYPSSGSVPTGSAYSYANRYIGLFLQDDWRVSNKLTLNLGLRWDYESPESERFNRVVTGFDTTTPYPLGNTTVRGGLKFGNSNNRYAYKKDLNNFQPRIGFAYRVSNKLVFRGGYGFESTPQSTFPASTGFSTTTSMVTQNPDFTPANILSNPFPAGLSSPTGNSLGLQTYLGRSLSVIYPDHIVPVQRNFTLGFQYELPFRSVISVTYAMLRQTERSIALSWDMNQIPSAQYFAMGPALQQQVTNPYAGLLPGTSFNGPMIQLGQLLRPYPQFDSINLSGVTNAKRWYDSMQAQFEKRLSQGLMVMWNYTFAKSIGQDQYLNGGHDAIDDLVKCIIPPDRTHVFNFAASYNLPFAANSKGITRQLLAGWNASTTISYQSGQPIGPLQGMTWTGADLIPANQTNQHWFNTCTLNQQGQRQNCASASEPVVWKLLGQFDRATMPSFLSQVRGKPTPLVAGVNLAVFKNFAVTERSKIEFRAEFFNLFNTPAWGGGFSGLDTNAGSPTFGQISMTSQANQPRVGQLALRFTF
jgi:hypothetical protein